MAKWQAAIVVAVVVLGGCTDPKSSRLHLAQYALLDGAEGGTVTAFRPNAANQPGVPLNVGTRVMVKVDDGPERDAERLVTVLVWEGPHKGELLDVRREALRLAAK
jgi:hypothetical protein